MVLLLVHLIKEHKSTCSIVYSTHAEEKILALEKDDFQAVLITFGRRRRSSDRRNHKSDKFQPLLTVPAPQIKT